MVARRQGVDSDTVDDVVQDTLLTVHRARQTYDPARSFAAWLSTIAKRRAIDRLRAQGRKRAREKYAPVTFEEFPDPALNPAEIAARTASNVVLTSAIATLPSGQREAVEHLALRELPLAEAAAETGRSEGALKVNLHRALKTLRAQLVGKD
jgi:RNA polymerase sigma-70 factor (ECF subfamily)